MFLAQGQPSPSTTRHRKLKTEKAPDSYSGGNGPSPEVSRRFVRAEIVSEWVVRVGKGNRCVDALVLVFIAKKPKREV